MQFMFLILAFLLCAVVWGFFHANPRGVNTALLNIDPRAGRRVRSRGGDPALRRCAGARPDHKALAVYLAIMVAGSGFMIVVAVGGLIRNLLVFPLSRRSPARSPVVPA